MTDFLIDDETSPDSTDIFYKQNKSVKEVAYNLPPDTQELFDKWLKSSQCKDWKNAWTYLATLTTRDYLRMYADLPEILAVNIPDKNTLKKEFFSKLKDKYRAKAIWLSQLTEYDTPNNQQIYSNEFLQYYKSEASLSYATLELCKTFVRHPEYEWNHIFFTPIYLWFWIEVATCLKIFEITGFTTPLDVERVVTKKEHLSDWKKLIEYYDLSIKDVKLKTANGLGDFLRNLPAILPREVKDLVERTSDDYNVTLQKVLNSHIKSMVSHRESVHSNQDLQIQQIHLKSKSQTELWISGAKKKRPKSNVK